MTSWPLPPVSGTHGVPVQREATVRARRALFHEASEIVAHEFASDLLLDELARRLASSRRQLQRAYAEVGKTTFREHLTGVRMRESARLLATRQCTIREVAERVGYRQPSQFAKAFRRYHGVTPAAVRALGRELAGRRAHEGMPAALRESPMGAPGRDRFIRPRFTISE